jgi:hypothetical protein
VQGNTLANPKFTEGGTLKTFDYVVANPPFSDKRWSTGLDALHDPCERFQPFGTPPAKQGDYAARRLHWHGRQLLGYRATGDRNAIAVDAIMIEQNFQQLPNATSPMEIHRNEAARGLQVTKDRSPARHALEVFDVPFHTRRFRDGEKMEHGIGRSACRHDNHTRAAGRSAELDWSHDGGQLPGFAVFSSSYKS